MYSISSHYIYSYAINTDDDKLTESSRSGETQKLTALHMSKCQLETHNDLPRIYNIHLIKHKLW